MKTKTKILFVYPFLEKAFKIIEKEKIVVQTAFDIGCGPGNESNFLINKDIQTTAFDYNKDCLSKLEESFPKIINNPKFKFVHTRIENIDWQPVDMVISIKVLSFLEEKTFFKTLEDIKKMVNKSGVLVLTFFGIKDDWKKCTLITKKELMSIFKEFEFLFFDEEIGIGKTVSGPDKNIHQFSLLLQKK